MALVAFTQRLQRRAEAAGLHLTAAAADPGMVDTALYDFLSGPARLAKRPFSALLFRVCVCVCVSVSVSLCLRSYDTCYDTC